MRYWKRVDAQGKTTTVESYSHDLDIKGAIEIKKAEFDAFIASLPPVEPGPDYKALYAKATTQAQKLSIIAKRLMLE